jgi:transcription initiation factor IIE alpha subunit
LDSLQWFACPECKSPVSEVLQGRELQVIALEIEALEIEALEPQDLEVPEIRK